MSCTQSSNTEAEPLTSVPDQLAEQDSNLHNSDLCEVDTSEVPEITESEKKLLDEWCNKSYRIISQILDGDNAVALTTKIPIFVERNEKGIAAASEGKIYLYSKWFLENRADEAEIGGVLAHEIVHIVQRYSPDQLKKRQWLVDGMADYIRFGKIYANSPNMNCNGGKNYTTDPYKCGAAFLNYILKEKPPEVIIELNRALREGTYNDDFFGQAHIAGKSLEDLWQECIQPGQDCEDRDKVAS